MKIFATLYAKLTGTAEAPKTLEQARSTFGEAKAAIDSIAELFAVAKLDLDAMLAKGKTALADHLAELQAKIDGAEAMAVAHQDKLKDANLAREQAEQKSEALSSQLSALSSVIAAIGFKPAELKDKDGKPIVAGSAEFTTAFQSAWNAHVANATTQKLAELGIAAAKLPAATDQDSAASYDEILAEAQREPDLAKRSQLVAKANRLRAQMISPAKN